MDYYLELSKRDLITKFKAEFNNGSFFLRDDGRIDRTLKIAHNTPWIHVKRSPNRHCGLYHIYHERLGFIHSTCQECWKVVVRPRTLVELHKLLNLEKALELPSKCGIEKRDTVCGHYGGYFYNDSLKEGRECYKRIRLNVDLNLDPEVKVILKRGCTEFELAQGPSDKWEVSEEQKQMEYLLSDLVESSEDLRPQPEHLKDSVFRSWIHWAYANGDLTYLEYTNNHPLFKPPVTYHEEEKNEEKEKHSLGSAKRGNKSGRKVNTKTSSKTKKVKR